MDQTTQALLQRLADAIRPLTRTLWRGGSPPADDASISLNVPMAEVREATAARAAALAALAAVSGASPQ